MSVDVDWDKPIQLRNGFAARVGSMNCEPPHSVCVFFKDDNGRELPLRVNLNGRRSTTFHNSEWDVVNAPDMRKGYVAVFESPITTIPHVMFRDTLEEAEDLQAENCVCVVPFEYERK